MRLEQLICLVEISRHKSLNMASEKLHMTQQALSSSMKTLENELGVQILHRSRKGCTLTREGEKLLAFSGEILPRYQQLLDEFRNNGQSPDHGELKGTLNIYVNSVFYLSLLADAIKRFCEGNPQLKVVILEHSPATICAKLVEPAAEGVHRIGFINAPCRENGNPSADFLPSPEVTFHPLARGSYHACVGKNSLLANSRELSIRTLLKYPLVIGASDDANTTPLHHLLSHYGTPHIVLSVGSLHLWNQAIISNVGVGFLHDIFLEHADYLQKYATDVVLIRIREKLPAVTGYLTSGAPDPVVNELLRCLPPSGGL